jgi:hypothetical protein
VIAQAATVTVVATATVVVSPQTTAGHNNSHGNTFADKTSSFINLTTAEISSPFLAIYG